MDLLAVGAMRYNTASFQGVCAPILSEWIEYLLDCNAVNESKAEASKRVWLCPSFIYSLWLKPEKSRNVSRSCALFICFLAKEHQSHWTLQNLFNSCLPAFSTVPSLQWWNTPTSLVDSDVNPGLAVWFAGLWCGQQQLKSVTPGPHPSGFHHQPWPLTRTKLQPGTGSTQLGNASVSLRHWKPY